MPVSLGEWRVRIGTFICRQRKEYDYFWRKLDNLMKRTKNAESSKENNNPECNISSPTGSSNVAKSSGGNTDRHTASSYKVNLNTAQTGPSCDINNSRGNTNSHIQSQYDGPEYDTVTESESSCNVKSPGNKDASHSESLCAEKSGSPMAKVTNPVPDSTDVQNPVTQPCEEDELDNRYITIHQISKSPEYPANSTQGSKTDQSNVSIIETNNHSPAVDDGTVLGLGNMKPDKEETSNSAPSGIEDQSLGLSPKHRRDTMRNTEHTTSIEEVQRIHGSQNYPVLGSGTTRGEADDMKDIGCPDMTNALLLRSGDVELNPGPNDTTMEPIPCLQQVELIRLSRNIPHTRYSELCVALGYSFELSQSILSTHLKEYNEAIVDILIKWNTRQPDTSRSRSILARKLHDVELGGLGQKLAEGEYLQKQQGPHDQEATPLQSSSGMAAHGGIADDLLFQLAEDIETGEQMEAFGRTLGFKVAEIYRYTEANRNEGLVTCKGTRAMLFDWRQTVKPCDQHLRLEHALIDAKLVMLADTHLKRTLIYPSIYSKKISASLTVQRCREKLENKYLDQLCKIQMKPWDHSDYAEFKDMHTVVTMVKKDGRGKDTKKKEILPGSVAEIFSTKVNGELPARILISAPAGRGKTTAVAKMAYDWVHRERGSALEHLPLLFVVKFRNTYNLTSIGEAIKSQLLSDVDDLTPEGLESFIRENQGICHIILDGLDEYAGISSSNRSLGSNIVSVISREEFPECRVLVTTRPHLENFFIQDDLPRVYTKMWIEGFSQETLREYIDKFFASTSRPYSGYGHGLKIYLDDQPLINELVKTPLFCLMVCHLWNEGLLNTVTATQTELLDRVNDLLMHHANARSKSYDKITKEELIEIIRKLGKVALAGLLDDSKKLVFTPHDFRKFPAILDKACELGIVSKTNVNIRCLPQSSETTSTTIEFYHKLAQEHSAAKYLAHQTDHKSDKVLRKIKANIGDYENLIRFCAGTHNKLGVRIMEMLLANNFLYESERYRILLDCSSETRGIERNVSTLVQRCVTAQSIVLKSPTVYTVVGMLNLPMRLKSEVRTVKFEESALTIDVTSGLWSCLGSFSMLRTLTISDSSLSFPPSPRVLPSVTKLLAERVTSQSYEGVFSSLPGLRDIDITIDDAERDIRQITAGLRRTGGQQLRRIRLIAPPSLPSENNCVSRETMRGLGLLIREQTKNLQWIGLSGMKSLNGEDFAELVESSTYLKALDSLRFKSIDAESFNYDKESDFQCLYFTRCEKILEDTRRTEEVLPMPADIKIQEAIRKGEAPWNRSRIMVIGPAGVGKTSLIRRLTGQKFDPDEESTKGAKQDVVTKSAVSGWVLVKDAQTANVDIIQSIAMDPTFESDTPSLDSVSKVAGRSNSPENKGVELDHDQQTSLDSVSKGAGRSNSPEKKGLELEHDQQTSVDSGSKVAGRSNSPGTQNIESPHTLDTPSSSSQQRMTKENVASTPEHRHIAESDIGRVKELTESERLQNTDVFVNSDSNRSTLGKENMSVAAKDDSSVKVLPTIAKISQGITREEITKVKSSALNITYNMWDFGGQEIYYITHPLFLSWRSLYILVIPLHLELSDKAPREEDDQKQLKGSAVRTHRTILDLVHFWLMSVYTHAVPDCNLDSTYEPKVLLIGTFAGDGGPPIDEEKVTAKFQELKDQLGSNPYWKQVLSPMCGIDNQFSPRSEVKKIQQRIDGLVKDSAYMKVLMPIKWRTFLTEIEDSDKKNLTVKEARSTMKTLGIDDLKEVYAVLKFYHDIGHLIYHQGCELIVLKPQFLNSIVSNIITVIDDKKMEGDLAKYWRDLKEKGVLSIELIKAVWKEHKGDHDQLDDIINMMIMFDLICEIPTERPDGRRFFVPCRSSSMLDEKECHFKDDKVEFTIDFNHFLPDGFLHRFYVRMAKWSMERKKSIKPTFHCRQMMFYIDNRHRVVMTNEIHSKERHQIKVTIYAVAPAGAPSERTNARVGLNKNIIDHLQDTLEDLKKRWARRIEYSVGILCPNCSEYGDKELIPLREILKGQDEYASCDDGCPVYVGDILKAFNKGTQLPSEKQGDSSIGVHVDAANSSSVTGNTFIGQQNITKSSRTPEPMASHQRYVQPPFVTPDCLQQCETSQQEYISGQKAGTVAESEQCTHKSDKWSKHLVKEFDLFFQTYVASQVNSQGLNTYHVREGTTTNNSSLSALPNSKTTSVPGTNIRGHYTGFKPMYELDNYDLDVPSTSGVNAQSSKMPEGLSAVTTCHLQPKGEGIQNNPEPDSTDEDDTTGEDKKTKSHSYKDDNLDIPPRKRKKKTNRQMPSP